MDEIPRDQIGYMQVQFKIYEGKEIYDQFTVNAHDECYEVDREHISAHHQVIDDPAKKYEKIFQLELILKKTGYEVAMHMPIHESESWESLGDFGDYDIRFLCILGKTPEELTPNKNKNEKPSAWTRLTRVREALDQSIKKLKVPIKLTVCDNCEQAAETH